jgi:hypothetical protein
MIRVTFEADDVLRLREQLVLFLNGPQPALKERVEALKADPYENIPDNAQAAPEPAPPPKKTKAPKAEPQQEAQMEDKTKIAIDLQNLKNEQLDRLRDLFNAGKGTYVRDLLKKHGGGAKVFPEVDAAQFPAIKKDIDKELGA